MTKSYEIINRTIVSKFAVQQKKKHYSSVVSSLFGLFNIVAFYYTSINNVYLGTQFIKLIFTSSYFECLRNCHANRCKYYRFLESSYLYCYLLTGCPLS